MVNVIAIAVLLLMIGGAIAYIYREKKKGRHCIGCPMAGNCPRMGNCGKMTDRQKRGG